MIRLLEIIGCMILLHMAIACKTNVTVIQKPQPYYVRKEKYFDSIIYAAYRQYKYIRYKSHEGLFDISLDIDENRIRREFEEERKGLYDAIYVNLKSDTLYILDCIAVEGYMSRVICWTNSDTCVKKFPDPDWYKGRTPVINNKTDALRFRLISSWNIELIHRLDSITDRLIQRGVWETRDGCFYIATRIIFKGDAASYEFVRFNRWPIDLVDKEYYDERPK